MSFDELTTQCLASVEHWKGCDWPTKHGESELNLQGLSAAQADMMSRATSGPESKDWRSAATWLRQIEGDARLANHLVRQAAGYLDAGETTRALENIEAACALEQKYRPAPIWQTIRDAIWLALKSPDVNLSSMVIVPSPSTPKANTIVALP